MAMATVLLRVGEDGKPVLGAFAEAAVVFQKSSKTCERLYGKGTLQLMKTMVLAMK